MDDIPVFAPGGPLTTISAQFDNDDAA